MTGGAVSARRCRAGARAGVLPLAGEEARPAVQELPRHAEQRRRAGERQREAHAARGPGVGHPGLVVGVADAIGEQRSGERGAQRLGARALVALAHHPVGRRGLAVVVPAVPSARRSAARSPRRLRTRAIPAAASTSSAAVGGTLNVVWKWLRSA